ncbi:DUF2147 domain-containing protein [Flavobacteriaceae bacterium XHP0103]|uniref:DUF2147 domain-containing protein n=1 Tax=Marixanthotalea marina TaxID=2844359 RepID=UPI002989BA4E|nr:DUF2147 domain-containing protein [Marixanthotalea marina]MBU3820976.1 DUF2147 domain-containing protein [Marixanthotalea marina]
MRSLKLFVLLFVILSTKLFAQTESEIIGKWESDNKDVQIEIFKKDGKYYGKYLWGKEIVEIDGKTSKKDTENPDPKLRSRNVIGITSLTDLTWNGNEYTNGKIYNAPSGDTYGCKVWIKNNKLNLRGYLGFSLLGRTATFHRMH